MGRALAAGLALGLAGCMSASDFADRAVEHNRAIAQASDEIMLLNIVRAAQNRPIVYTRFSGVSENFSNSAGLTLSLPFGPDAASAYEGSAELGPEQFVSLETAPLDDVDFYQGVMRPVQVGLLGYYLKNGWPPDLVMSLAVEKLSIGEAFYKRVLSGSDELCRQQVAAPGACSHLDAELRHHPIYRSEDGRLEFTNDPRDANQFRLYHDLVLRLIALGLSVEGTYVTHELEVPATMALASDADQLQKLIGMGARVQQKGSTYVITTSSWTPTIRLTHLSGSKVGITRDRTLVNDIDLTASLRSPDSILFYAGVYTRGGSPGTDVLVDGAGQGTYMPVIRVGNCDDAIVQVEFEGICYGIPRGGQHLSMKVLAFLHQVFGLNKKAVEPPSVGTVKVVN